MPTVNITTPDLLTFKEVAKKLGVSRPTLYRMVERQELHPVLIGRNRYLFRAEVELIKSRR